MKEKAILLIDDCESMLDVFNHVLMAFGFIRLVYARNNADAWIELKKNKIELIIQDLIRSGGTGLEFLAEIAQSEFASIPVIIQSGNVRNLELEAWRAGARHVFAKPWAIEPMLRAITSLLSLPSDPIEAIIFLGVESRELDYKARLPVGSRDERAAVAKDVLAMANYGGGQIVVGVEEIVPGKFAPIGVNEAQCRDLEVSRLNRAISGFIDPPVHVNVRRHEVRGQIFLIIDVPAAEELTMVAKENAFAGLFKGRIYSRTSAVESAELQSASEVRWLLKRFF